MIPARHPFAVRSLNARDEQGLEGCATCGRPRWAHPVGNPPCPCGLVSFDHTRAYHEQHREAIFLAAAG